MSHRQSNLNSVNTHNISAKLSSLSSFERQGNSESEHFNELSQGSISSLKAFRPSPEAGTPIQNTSEDVVWILSLH